MFIYKFLRKLIFLKKHILSREEIFDKILLVPCYDDGALTVNAR